MTPSVPPDDSSDLPPPAPTFQPLPPCPIQPLTGQQSSQSGQPSGAASTATSVAVDVLAPSPLPTPEPPKIPQLPQSHFIPNWWQQWAVESVQAGFPDISISIGLIASVLVNLEIALTVDIDTADEIINSSDGSICGQCSRCCEQCSDIIAKCNSKIDDQLAIMLGEAMGRMSAITGQQVDAVQPAYVPPQPDDTGMPTTVQPVEPTPQKPPAAPFPFPQPNVGKLPDGQVPFPPDCQCPPADYAFAFYGPGYYYIAPQQYPVCICISCTAIADSIARAFAIALGGAAQSGPLAAFAQLLADALKIPKQDIPPPATPPDKAIYESDVHYADGEPIYTQGLDEFLRVDGPIMPIIVGPEAWQIPDQQDPNRVLSDKKE